MLRVSIAGLTTLLFLVSTINPVNGLFVRKKITQEELYRHLIHLNRYNCSRVKNKKYLKRLVFEASLVVENKNNRWLTSQDLLGLATGESDLRWWTKTGKGYLYDCGICQNHTPIYARSIRERRKLCKLLMRSTYLSFVYAAHELNLYRNKYCMNKRSRHYVSKPIKRKNESTKSFNRRLLKYKQQMYKCVFTLYNQGPNHTWRHNPYWIRTMCFIKSVERGKYPRYPCRKMRYLWQLKYWMRKSR